MNTQQLVSGLLSIFVASTELGQAQPDVRDQAEAAFKRADAELNQTYKRLLTKIESHPDLPKRLSVDLQKAQRQWIAFRDAEAAFRAGLSSAGGSAYSMDYFSTLAELTEQRTQNLKKRFKSL